MRKITEIRKVGTGARYKLFLDDEYFGTYEAEILARHGLKSGEEYDEKFFEDLKFENGDYACFNRGLSSLEKSMKSEKMLRDYLKEREYPLSCIDKAVDKLKDYGYIDDEAFCDNFISIYSGSKSRRKIKYDLLSKGVNVDLIERKLENLNDEDEEEKCYKFAKKYMKNKEFDLKNKQKLYNHLAGKGFEFGFIGNVWERLQNDVD